MLLNLSNHPSSSWSSAQIQAATDKYGAITDLEFPAIGPLWTLDEVKMIAERHLEKIRQYASESQVTVHLMGELTFCFLLLEKLKEAGIRAVASTSKRISVLQESGHKQVSFEFEQFRPYY